ncbi:MAG: ATP-dependent helicase HrpB [Rectinemataceae bacterium]|jgi:ATP-dependent helicase HrpB
MHVVEPSNALPIAANLPEIVRLLAEAGALVLTAEPGAGKTSLVPPAIADSLAGKVLVMEPRRVAAVAAAARIAELWGRKLGDEVGYRVRGESSTSPRARIEAVTPGVLVRMIQSDPGLETVGCVVLDEFHERSVQADLAFALLVQSRLLRPGLSLLAMSATMDSRRATTILGAAVLDVPGRSFPIETRHVRLEEGRGFEAGDASRPLARAALELIDEAKGDVLVFLPGASEIARAAAEFTALARSRGRGGRCPEAVVLHGSLPLEAQRRVLAPPLGSPPRAIFATSVAETSLTVPRVRAVIDSGLARLARFQARAGLNRLVTEREAQDRADQRRGRAGRLGPGICLRAWPASEVLPTRTEPEILRAELSGLVLEAALWGSPARLDLAWIDSPPEGAWKAGKELLVELGALDADSSPADFSPTAFGRRMAILGTEPRLAALVLRGIEAGAGWTACLAAALLSERGGAGGNDIAQRLEEIDAEWEGGPDSGKRGEYGPVFAEARRLARSAGIPAAGPSRPDAVGPLLAAAFPDRIAERMEYRGANASFRIPAGRMLRATGPLAQSPWIVALDADAGASEGRIYSACAIDAAEALAALESRAVETVEAEWKGLELKLAKSRRVGAIVLGTGPAERPSREELASLLASRIVSEGLGILPWEEGAAEALARLRYFAGAAFGSAGKTLDAASLSETALAARAAEWLGPCIDSEDGPLMDGPSLKRAVSALAPRALRSEMDRVVPERIELPSGSTRQINYRSPGGPFVEARVQEFFGLSEHPRVRGVPLVLRLLDPGGKPLQVTSDLPGFWRGSWAQARKELRGRYPRHEWPEDPGAALPSRSGIKKRTR